MKDQPQIWDGKAVSVTTAGKELQGLVRLPVNVLLSEEGARRVAMALASYAAIRAHHKTLGNIQKMAYDGLLLPEVQELLDALNYTLVGDPVSTRAYKAMQAGKSMTPDGGHRAPLNLPGPGYNDAFSSVQVPTTGPMDA